MMATIKKQMKKAFRELFGQSTPHHAPHNEVDQRLARQPKMNAR
jgi:hypothetical protein